MTITKVAPLQILSSGSWVFWQVLIFCKGMPRNFFNSTGFIITTTVLPALFSKHKVIPVVCSKGTQMKIPQVLLGDKCLNGCRFFSITLKDNSVTSKLVLHTHPCGVWLSYKNCFQPPMFPIQVVWCFLKLLCILPRMHSESKYKTLIISFLRICHFKIQSGIFNN